MNVASVELCRELYELSGWRRPEWVSSYRQVHRGVWWGRLLNDKWRLVEEAHTHAARDYPAYDLGYLLRKLPPHFYGGSLGMCAETEEGPTRYSFFYDDNFNTGRVIHYKETRLQAWADTPEDAAAKLATQLFKQGVLTRGGDA